jgi:hypothetical protein
MNIFIVLERLAPVNSTNREVGDLPGNEPSLATPSEEFCRLYSIRDSDAIIKLDDTRHSWPDFFTPRQKAPEAPRGCHAVAMGLGRQDALDGYPFAPETYFFNRSLQDAYSIGFESIRGANEITRQFTRSGQG